MAGKYDHLFAGHTKVAIEDMDIPQEFIDTLMGLPPGKGAILELAPSGEEYMVIRLEDFDHIARLANLRRKDVPP